MLTAVSRPPRIPTELATGPFRGSQAVASGSITKAMLAGSAWRRLLPDVYAHHSVELDHRAWCAAALLALPPSVAIGGASAAFLWGAADAPTSVHVVAPRTRRLRRDDRISVHYTTLADTDVTPRGDLRLTTPERTMFDLARRTLRADAVAVLDAMLHRHLLDPYRLQRMARERGTWPRAGDLARLLPLADPRGESPMETRLRLLLVDAGTPPPAAQFEVRAADGTLAGRVDLAWPEHRLAVEYDGDHHRTPEQFRRDVYRLNHLRLAGWTVLRFTADDVLRRSVETAVTVAAILAQLSSQPPVGHAIRLP